MKQEKASVLAHKISKDRRRTENGETTRIRTPREGGKASVPAHKIQKGFQATKRRGNQTHKDTGCKDERACTDSTRYKTVEGRRGSPRTRCRLEVLVQPQGQRVPQLRERVLQRVAVRRPRGERPSLVAAPHMRVLAARAQHPSCQAFQHYP